MRRARPRSVQRGSGSARLAHSDTARVLIGIAAGLDAAAEELVELAELRELMDRAQRLVETRIVGAVAEARARVERERARTRAKARVPLETADDTDVLCGHCGVPWSAGHTCRR